MNTQGQDFQQAYALLQTAQLSEALALISQSLKQGDNPYLFNLQGVIYMQLNQAEKALKLFLKTLPLAANESSFFVNAANCARQLQQHTLAAEISQRLFSIQPTEAQALITGLDCYAAQEISLALQFFEKADPQDPERWFYAGLIYDEQGAFTKAVSAFEQTFKLDPEHWRASFRLAQTLEKQAKPQAAITACQQALRLNPNNAQIAKHLAELHLKQGAWKQASHSFETLLFQVRGTPLNLGGAAASQIPPPQQILMHKLEHDLEQLNYLLSQDLLPPDYRGQIEDLGLLKQELSNAKNQDLPLQLSLGQHARLATIWGRNIYIEPAPFRKQSVLNPDLDLAALESAYLKHSVGLVVVDNLLKPEICEHVYRYASRSTIWHASDKQGGYVGAFMNDGLACGLIYQIAQELRSSLPAIFQQALLKYMWAFKYDSLRRGINVHGDQAAINVNFWVTPDAANLDPQSGGLIVYDKKAPAHWSFEQMNLSDQTVRIYQFLDQSQAQAIRIPYRCNRAVIFCSDLFHATDYFRFQPDYLSRRINFTLLYGQRGNLL